MQLNYNYAFCDYIGSISIPCFDLNAPTNGAISYDDGFSNDRPTGTIATHSCIAGYIIDGSITRTCRSNGLYTGSEPSCRGK